MGEEELTGLGTRPPGATPVRRLMPMHVGGAIVYVEQVGEPASVEAQDDIHPVAPPSPDEAFQSASQILNECVRVIGEKVEAIAAEVRPDELAVEFSLSFEVKGRASLIPVFVTGEAGTQTGLKVKATWKRAPDGGG